LGFNLEESNFVDLVNSFVEKLHEECCFGVSRWYIFSIVIWYINVSNGRWLL